MTHPKGIPHPDYFPFATLEATTLPIDTYSATPEPEAPSSAFSWIWNLFSGPSKQRTNKISVPKYVSDPINDVNLATCLQYGAFKLRQDIIDILTSFKAPQREFLSYKPSSRNIRLVSTNLDSPISPCSFTRGTLMDGRA